MCSKFLLLLENIILLFLYPYALLEKNNRESHQCLLMLLYIHFLLLYLDVGNHNLKDLLFLMIKYYIVEGKRLLMNIDSFF